MSTAIIAMPREAQDIVMLKGGLDQVTPRLELGPGAARRMVNFECGINGGYSRIRGYERFDGRDSPSSKTFTLLPIVTFFSTPLVSTTLTSISGASGTIIAVGSNYVVVANVTGTFQEGDMVSTSFLVVGVIGPQTVRLSKSLRKQYVSKSADVWRAFIGAVSGSGPVRGVFGAIFNGAYRVYVFRDEVDGSSCRLWGSSSTGWQPLNPTLEMSFKNGTNVAGQPPDGSLADFTSISQGTRICRRILTESGSWFAGTATGRVIMDTYATVSGAPFPIGDGTFQPTSYPTQILQKAGGHYEFFVGNFSGQLSSARIYGCDGTNRCFEFDGTTFAPIAIFPVTPSVFSTFCGIDPHDKPTHIQAHQQHLFVALGSSFFNSGPGQPYDFTALHGGGQAATGDTVSGFQVLPGSQAQGAMAILGRNHTQILYGSALDGPNPFKLVNFETQTGAIAGTIQTIDHVYYVDDRGIIDIEAVQAYGNFVASTITRAIQPFMDLKRGRAVCSTVNRSKNQYRVFFLDGTGLFLTIDNGQMKGAAPVAFPHQLACAWSGEDETGAEHTYVGSRDGFVYEMERGTSFDGAPIVAEILLNWNAMGSPRLRKSIHGSAVEFSEDSDHVEMSVGTRMGPELTAHPTENIDHVSVTEIDAQWNHFNWGNVWWDGKILSPMELDVRGTSERVQFYFKSDSNYLEPFTMTAIITRYFKRRGVRG